jgi:hypothetical protein
VQVGPRAREGHRRAVFAVHDIESDLWLLTARRGRGSSRTEASGGGLARVLRLCLCKWRLQTATVHARR